MHLTQSSIASWMALRVLRIELGRRLPGVEVVVLTRVPVQSPLDGGDPVDAVGDWTPERRAELATCLDCVAVLFDEPDERPGDGPGWPPPDGLGQEHESSCPSITVEPSSLCALAPLVFDDEVLDMRLAWMGLLGIFSPSQTTVRLDAAGPLSLEDVAALVRSATVVEAPDDLECLCLAYDSQLVPTAEALASPQVDLTTRQVWARTLLDALASTAARAQGPRPGATPNALSQIAHAARERQRSRYRMVLAEQTGALTQERRQAEAAGAAAAAHSAEIEARLGQLRQGASEGYARFEAQAAAQRAKIEALVAEGEGLRAEIRAQVGELEALARTLAEVEGGRAALERELEATHATRLFRYAAVPRRIYGTIRRWHA